jgi:putative ABC transport system ATP-binding protein
VTQMSMLSMSGVRKTYSTGVVEVEALRGIDLEIENGEYLAIMGPSGSGKSTLMHIIGCLDVPTAGSYRLDGTDVSKMSEKQLAEIRNQKIGFVFQQFNLLASLTALRNVELPLVYAGVPASERKERAMAALAKVGLAQRVQHRPGELSGGQQQRVSVARALVTDPALILADEPTGALDSHSTREILDLFQELNDSGRTIVVITHEAEVGQEAKHLVHIYDGLLREASPVAATGAQR